MADRLRTMAVLRLWRVDYYRFLVRKGVDEGSQKPPPDPLKQRSGATSD